MNNDGENPLHVAIQSKCGDSDISEVAELLLKAAKLKNRYIATINLYHDMKL